MFIHKITVSILPMRMEKKQGFWIEDNECAYYVDDVLHGLSISYFKKNHNLFRIGEFENGEYAGTWMFLMKKLDILVVKYLISS